MAKVKKPSWIQKVNGVMSFIENPCNAPWVVYAELALPAATDVVIELLSFDFPDVVRGALRPRGLRGHRHFRKGARGGKGSGGIPELGEIVGKSIPHSATARGRHVSQGVKNLWILDGVIQRVLWYWLIVSLTTDFFYEWTTAVMRSEYCSKQGQGNAFAQADNAILTNTFGGWSGVPSPDIHYATGYAYAQHGLAGNSEAPFVGIGSYTGTNDGSFPLLVAMRSRIFGFTRELLGPKTVNPGEEFSGVMSLQGKPGQPLAFEIAVSGLGAMNGKGSVSSFSAGVV